MTNVVKYKLSEVLHTVFFFSVIAFFIIYINDIEDFPLLRGLIAALFISLAVFFFEVFLFKKLHEYLTSLMILLLSIIYYLLAFIAMLISSIYIILIFKQGIPINNILNHDISLMIPDGINKMLFYMFIFLTIRLLILQLKYRTLQGTAKKLLWGRSGDTVKDVRIFMFMDLTSSTTYAEKLGYSVYSKFIKDIYREIDEFVIATKGIIYQYVGDEVVVVWSMENGLLNYNCIRFFYLFDNRIKELEKYFITNYGISPKFKAAFHFGEVAVAEIGGVLRRDVAFHGDAVNTTARICAKCRDLKEQILISGDLINELIDFNKENYFECVGKYNLKGKSNEMELFVIDKEARDKITFIQSKNSTFDKSLKYLFKNLSHRLQRTNLKK